MMRKTILFLLLLAPLCGAANVFSGDPNCVSLYRLESAAETVDSIGTNTLLDNLTDVNTVHYKEGSASAYFPSAGTEFLTRYNANLSANFPGKSGTTNDSVSVCFWFMPTGFEQSAGNYLGMVSKFAITTAQRSWQVGLQVDAVDTQLYYPQLWLGYNSGDSTELFTHASNVQLDHWYHIGVTFDGDTNDVLVRVFDATAAGILGTDIDTTAANPMYLGTADFTIGRMTNNTSRDFFGNIDEVVLFNDVLSAAEIDMIRNGTYPTGGGATLAPHANYYRRMRR